MRTHLRRGAIVPWMVVVVLVAAGGGLYNLIWI